MKENAGWFVVPVATAAITIAWVVLEYKKRQLSQKLPRRASYTSLGLALGTFPVEANVPEAIINTACYFKQNDLPSIDAIVCEIIQPLLENYERMAMVLDVTTGYFQPATEPYTPIDLIRNIEINCPDETIVHQTIFNHHNDSLMQYKSTRPWWEILVVDNKGIGPSALVIRVHHALADGLSLVHAFSPLLKKKKADSNTNVGTSQKQTTQRPTRSNRGKQSLSIGAFINRFFSLLEGTIHVLTLGVTKYDHNTIFSRCNHGKMKYSGQRDFVILPKIPLSFIKELKTAANCTVNTIIMTAISQAIHDYCVSQNDPIVTQDKDNRASTDVRCRALLPVGFPRSTIELSNPQTALSNKWCMISCEMYIGYYKSIQDRLQRIHTSMSQIKESSRPIMQLCIQNGIAPLLPRTVARQAVMDVFSRHSCVLTNVPGHEDICELAGKEVTGVQLFFCNLLTQIDIISYANNIFGNIVYDPNALPNFETFDIHYAKALVSMAKEFEIEPPSDLLLLSTNDCAK